MIKFLPLAVLLSLVLLLTSCSSARFFKHQAAKISVKKAIVYAQLPNLAALTTDQLQQHCQSLPSDSDMGLVLLVHCSNQLLSRNNLSQATRQYALSSYNNALYKLIKIDNQPRFSTDRVILQYTNLAKFTFNQEMTALDSRLNAKTFGQLGVPIVTNRSNSQTGLDHYYPLEGISRAGTIIMTDIQAQGLSYKLTLEILTAQDNTAVKLGANQYSLRHSPGSAFLALIEKATIDDYNWLGFVSPAQAEKRRGVFAIGEIRADKVPIIMIHGLNSDPLIWRHLTMAMLNEPDILAHYQIWHIYYPSGPPPYYSAARTRELLRDLLHQVKAPKLLDKAVIIGHSMGGVIAKLLATETQYSLWDTSFTQRPEQLLTADNASLKDIFIFQPVFKHNTVFFLDTPFKGSQVANSAIGYLGAMLVSLPNEFTQIFKALIERVGPDAITHAMQPFLLGYGPNSIQVLRPGHPLTDVLYDLPLAGEAYAIIGSNSLLSCEDEILCSQISDGVVSFDSANYHFAKESIIAPSSHNSFQSQAAIDFIISKLKAPPNTVLTQP